MKAMVNASPSSNVSASGLSATIIFCTLLALKVCGPLADLSWWWVTVPLWGPMFLILTVVFVALMGMSIMKAVGK